MEFKSLKIELNGTVYKSLPLHMTIVDTSSQTLQRQKKLKSEVVEDKNSLKYISSHYSFFAIATLDKPDVYFGEKVMYTLDFYHRSHLFQVATSEPDFSSFWAEKKEVSSSSKRKVCFQ